MSRARLEKQQVRPWFCSFIPVAEAQMHDRRASIIQSGACSCKGQSTALSSRQRMGTVGIWGMQGVHPAACDRSGAPPVMRSTCSCIAGEVERVCEGTCGCLVPWALPNNEHAMPLRRKANVDKPWAVVTRGLGVRSRLVRRAGPRWSLVPGRYALRLYAARPTTVVAVHRTARGEARTVLHTPVSTRLYSTRGSAWGHGTPLSVERGQRRGPRPRHAPPRAQSAPRCVCGAPARPLTRHERVRPRGGPRVYFLRTLPCHSTVSTVEPSLLVG